MSMEKNRLHRVLLGVLAVFVVFIGTVVAAAWYLNQGLLSGETSHDFGEMMIEDGRFAVTRRHTFELVNRSAKTQRILGVQPSCGCTEATPSKKVIEPGETIEITTALTLNRSGEKRTHATIIYENEEMQRLHLRGVGRRANPLSTPARALSITDDMPVTLRITLEMSDHDATPGEPRIEAPENAEVEFTGWRQTYAGDASREKPALWKARLRAQQVAPSLPDDAQLMFAMPELSERARLVIPLQTGGRGMIVGDNGSINVKPPNNNPREKQNNETNKNEHDSEHRPTNQDDDSSDSS